MATQNSVGKKSWGKRILKGLGILVILLVAAVLVTKGALRYSGSNQWELVGDHKGVKIYSLKTPGADSKKFKCVFQVKSTLAGLVTLMQDPDACADMGCTGSRVVERVDPNLVYSTFQYKLPSPFKNREFVVRTLIHQSPNKEVLVEYTAAPGKTPPDSCCLRVTDFNNSWRLTPTGDGHVNIEYIVDMNEGGFVPDILLNAARPRVMFKVLPRLQKILDKPKYQTAKLDTILE